MDRLTIRKSIEICETKDYKVTGFVMREPDGKCCVVEQSAVRWITRDDWWDMMHPAIKTEREIIIGLLGAAVCPCCDGGGAYYDDMGEPCQCQWCYEKDLITNKNNKNETNTESQGQLGEDDVK